MLCGTYRAYWTYKVIYASDYRECRMSLLVVVYSCAHEGGNLWECRSAFRRLWTGKNILRPSNIFHRYGCVQWNRSKPGNSWYHKDCRGKVSVSIGLDEHDEHAPLITHIEDKTMPMNKAPSVLSSGTRAGMAFCQLGFVGFLIQGWVDPCNYMHVCS